MKLSLKRDTLDLSVMIASLNEAPNLYRLLPLLREALEALGVRWEILIIDGDSADGTRKVVSVAEVQGLKGDNIVLQELFVWEKAGVAEDGRFTGVFKTTGAIPSFAPKLETIGLPFPEGIFEA